MPTPIMLINFFEPPTLDEYEDELEHECLKAEHRDFMRRWEEAKEAKQKAKCDQN